MSNHNTVFVYTHPRNLQHIPSLGWVNVGDNSRITVESFNELLSNEMEENAYLPLLETLDYSPPLVKEALSTLQL